MAIEASAMRKRKEGSGFTLIEVLVAMGILAVVLLGAANMQTSSIRYNTMGRDLTDAIAYAEARMEEITATPYAQVVAAQFPAENNGTFTRRVTVNPDLADPINGIKTVTVTVNWNGVFARNFVITSTLSRPQTIGQ